MYDHVWLCVRTVPQAEQISQHLQEMFVIFNWPRQTPVQGKPSETGCLHLMRMFSANGPGSQLVDAKLLHRFLPRQTWLSEWHWPPVDHWCDQLLADGELYVFSCAEVSIHPASWFFSWWLFCTQLQAHCRPAIMLSTQVCRCDWWQRTHACLQASVYPMYLRKKRLVSDLSLRTAVSQCIV